MQARYYDPVIGRFYSNDPLGFRDVHSFNRYAYANNNPYKYTDPSGAIAESVWDAASLSVGLTSLGGNLWNGNWGAAGIDALGVIADGAALAIPVVPGGAGMLIKGSRESSEFVSGATGTVYDSIKATQDLIPGTSVPRSFEISVDSGSFWVHGNGTKHMEEYLTRNGMSHGTSMSSQAMLSSFRGALNEATKNGYKANEMIHSGGWELMLGAGKAGDQLPVIKHAMPIYD